MTPELRIGIIGAGRIAWVHAASLVNHISAANVLAVADVVGEAARKLANRMRIPETVCDYRVLLDDKRLDAVIICSSTDTHARMIEEAAAAKKHIFCEKPIAFDLEQIDRALAAAERAGVKLQIGFNRRFDPSFRRVRDLVASGRIGTPHLLRITSRDPQPPPYSYIKLSGGIFLDMTIHDFDLARYLMGSEVEEVYSAGNVLVDPEIGRLGDLDTHVTTLSFASGALGVIDNSRRAVYGYDQRLEVFGSGGVAMAGNRPQDHACFADGEAFHSTKPLYFFPERYPEAFLEEMREFVEAVLNDRIPPVTGTDGRAPVVIALAARKSYDEHRPVKVNEIERPR